MIPLIIPKVTQSSQTESLGFPSYPLPLDTPGTLKNPIYYNGRGHITWRLLCLFEVGGIRVMPGP